MDSTEQLEINQKQRRSETVSDTKTFHQYHLKTNFPDKKPQALGNYSAYTVFIILYHVRQPGLNMLNFKIHETLVHLQFSGTINCNF